MKKTPKYSIIAILVGLLVFCILGAAVAFGVKSFTDSMDKLQDEWGDLIKVPDEESDSDSEQQPGESEQQPNDSESTAPVEKTKFTLDDLHVGITQGTGSNSGRAYFCYYLDTLKANTSYKISWSFDSTIKDVPVYFEAREVNGNIVYYVFGDTDMDLSNGNKSGQSSKESDLLTNDITFSTTENCTLMFLPFYIYVDSYDQAVDYLDEIEKHINYIEFEEVTS